MALVRRHYAYWHQKWGFDMLNPDMDDVRRRYEGTELWWLVTFPGLVIVLIALCINFIGDGLRDALDPTQRRVRA